MKLLLIQATIAFLFGSYYLVKGILRKDREIVANALLWTPAAMSPGIWLLVGFFGFIYACYVVLEVIPDFLTKDRQTLN